MRVRTLQLSSSKSWSPPPPMVYNLNFDGASKGDPIPVGFGGLCKDSLGRIIFIFLGAIGRDSNNSPELEGMLQGLHCLVHSNSFPVIIEGDSRILVLMA